MMMMMKMKMKMMMMTIMMIFSDQSAPPFHPPLNRCVRPCTMLIVRLFVRDRRDGEVHVAEDDGAAERARRGHGGAGARPFGDGAGEHGEADSEGTEEAAAAALVDGGGEVDPDQRERAHQFEDEDGQAVPLREAAMNIEGEDVFGAALGERGKFSGCWIQDTGRQQPFGKERREHRTKELTSNEYQCIRDTHPAFSAD